MPSGKRQSVLVFCVSPLKELYLDPIEHYDPDVIYVFRSKEDNAFAKISNEIYSSTTIKCNSIKEIITNISDYGSVLAEILDIREQLYKHHGDDLDIFLNISSGTHEFAAAAAFASMVKKNLVAFNVDVNDFGVDVREIKEFVERLSPEVNDPERIRTSDYNEPDDELLIFMEILAAMLPETKYPKHSDIINKLKDAGGWTHNPNKKSGRGRTPIEKKEEMYLSRHYFQPAINEGWIKDSKRKIELTEKGNAIIDVFGEKMILNKCSESVSLSDSNTDKMVMHGSKHMIMDLHRADVVHHHIKMNLSDSDFDYDDSDEENVVEINRKGKSYRFRINME